MADKKYPIVYLACPTLDGRVSVELVQSMMDLKNVLYNQRVHLRSRFLIGNSMLFTARNLLADDFLNSDADIALLVDSDISFKAEDVAAALPHVGNNIVGFPCAKRFPKWDRAVQFMRENPEVSPESITAVTGDANFAIDSDIVRPDANGLVDVAWIGTGMMLVSRGALVKMQEYGVKKYNAYHGRTVSEFFNYSWDEKGNGYSGEDVSFCETARKAGVRVSMKVDAVTSHQAFVPFVFDARVVNQASRSAKKKS